MNTKNITIALFLISIFFLSFLPTKDPDFGWHYRYGKDIIQTKTINKKNRFSYFLPHYKSVHPHLLYSVPLAWTYDHFGFNGLSFFNGFIIGTCGLIFIYLLSGPLWFKMVGFYITYLLSLTVFGLGIRSQILTYLFSLVTLLILKKAKKRYFYLLLLLPLFLIWVNTHIGFFLGLILLLFWITDLSKKKIPITVGILSISFLVTLINPFGIGVYKEILNHAFSPLGKMIAEWVPPSHQQMIIITSGLIGIVFLEIRSKKISLFNLLLATFLAIIGLKARRNLPFFYTIFFYILSLHLNKIIPQLEEKTKSLAEILLILVSSLTAFLAIINISKTIKFNSSWQEYCHHGVSNYPCQAIKNYPSLHGNVYATYEWGGFLIWKKPQIKVFVDGRMPAWKDKNGESPYKVYLDILQTQPGWNEKLKKWKTDYLLISRGTFLDLLLQKGAKKYGWQNVYHDEGAVIYKKI